MDVEFLAAAAIYLYSAYNYYVHVHQRRVIKRKWRKRRWWMVTIHRNRTRETMNQQLAELLAEPSGEFDNFVRMSCTDFEYLLQKISPIVSKQDTTWREAVPTKIRLALTLRFLVTGDDYRSLHYLFKISNSLISRIIIEVCLALNDVLQDMIKMPESASEWMSVSEGFSFPHCLGAIDGKHINIQSPLHSGTEYFNYKGNFSIVLLALVDSNYCFLFADVGSQGRISDGGVFNQSILYQKLSSNSMNLPRPIPLPNSDIVMPYVFLGDGAFALSTHLMKPFSGHHALGSPERVFNQELSRSRVKVENTFGILTARFRIFKKHIPLEPTKASIVTMTCLYLHNFLRKSTSSQNIYSPPGSFDIYQNEDLVRPGSWRNNGGSSFLPLLSIPRRPPRNATQIRLDFMNYFFGNRDH
ncbi:putative nuclease HARBI1 [Colias croceus]|uniref:putative nuclease HARBI1 n=1 Tax=Colias crocea TaxID=72248 RepID=UPI001E27AAA8|nr:putative nuclease HARBI1 [Colias croceus]XP_045504932.1 putative nuclease HARBI1 [Colias croceus]